MYTDQFNLAMSFAQFTNFSHFHQLTFSNFSANNARNKRNTVKPPIKDMHSERGQTAPQRTNRKYSVYRKSPLKEDNLFTKDKTAGY